LSGIVLQGYVVNPLLDGARAKHARAKKHVDDLKQAMVDYKQEGIFRFDKHCERPTRERLSELGVTAHDDTPWGLITLYVRDVLEAPHPLSTIAGDALNNFRAALDYVAWECVALGTKPNPVREQNIKFPIIDKWVRNDWKAVCGEAVPGIASAHLGVIRNHQPFTRGKDAHSHPFWRLRDLGGKEKHRRLLIIAMGLVGGQYTFAPHDFVPITTTDLIERPVVLEPGLKLSRVFGLITGDSWEDSSFPTHLVEVGLAFQPNVYIEPLMEAIDAEVAAVLDEIDALL
jgi:hypothetical protein